MNPLNPFDISQGFAQASPLSVSAEFVSALSEAARSSIPFINQGVSLGLSAESILGNLRSRGIRIGRNEGLSLVRLTRGAFAAGRLQNKLKGPELPKVTDFTAAKYYTDKRYTYTIKNYVTYEETGTTGIEFVNITSDSLLSNDDLAESLDNLILTSAADYNFKIQRSEVDSVLVDPRYMP